MGRVAPTMRCHGRDLWSSPGIQLMERRRVFQTYAALEGVQPARRTARRQDWPPHRFEVLAHPTEALLRSLWEAPLNSGDSGVLLVSPLYLRRQHKRT